MRPAKRLLGPDSDLRVKLYNDDSQCGICEIVGKPQDVLHSFASLPS